ADLGRDDRLTRVRGGGQELVGVRAVTVDLGRVLLELGLVRHRHDRQRPGQRRANVRVLPTARVARLALGDWVRLRLIALADADEDVLAVGRDGQGGRIPAGRDVALHFALVPLGYVNDGDAIVVGVGDEERLAVRADRESVGRAALGAARE